jgi:hypothetical protein
VKISAKTKKEFLKNKWFYGLLILTAIVLIAIRSFPYILHGSFGFGYDTGIYKKVFEGLTNFMMIFKSEIYVLPAFLAYVFNLLHIPLSLLLYYAYILFSVLIAWPLYLLTKEFFGKIAALVAVLLFTISYVQVFASEYYFFKGMLGAVFMLFGFLYFVRKSYKFYIFAILLALTQLPQFLILLVGTGIASLFEWKKNKKFHLIGLLAIVFAFVLLAILTPRHLVNAWNIVFNFVQSKPYFDPHVHGSFMSFMEFLYRESWILVMSVIGFIFAYKKKGSTALQVAVVFLIVVVAAGLFFERRYVIELGLLLIPYGGYLISLIYEKWFGSKTGKIFAVCVFLLILTVGTVYHFKTTYPAVNKDEQWALEVISAKKDGNYVLVTNSFYAPWAYGFTNKIALAPGIFASVWDFDTWTKYIQAPLVEQSQMLIDVANKYGKVYLFEGIKQKNRGFEKQSPLIKKVYDINGARVYKISPSPLAVPSSEVVLPVSSPSVL